MKRKNGHDVEVTRPLKHRPGVIVVRSNGTLKVIGDGALFSSEEFVALHGGYAPSTTPPLEYSDAEQTELDAADKRMQRAAKLFNSRLDESAQQTEAIDAAFRRGDSEYDIQRLQRQAHEIARRVLEARTVYEDALADRNATEKRIQSAARARQRPVEHHTPPRSIDERLSDMEGRK